MYTITIKKTETIKKQVGENWDIVGQESIREGSDEQKDVYDYTPKIEKEVEVEREVLKQTVKELDMAAVIKSINNL